METNWEQALQPLFQQYGKRRHPLDYQNRYQLVVMVILSAQDSDKHINELAPNIFAAYPTMNSLSQATEADLQQHIGSVRNWGNKAKWLIKLAQSVGEDENIPCTLEGLTKLPGLGRKSANVIIRESGDKAEGVIVDLHVLRVAPRLGIADEKDATKPEKIEKQIMAVIPQEFWNEAGMSISFLGRELCRPTNPKCTECLVNSVCQFFQSSGR
ncbi:MAG: endonuclease III [Prolixibacteraceae bacterium]|nr:endonuclease III [Prolixibacteraceae bacterium]